jgi:HAD superfamily hydrolase (TIGR01484 family)
MQPFIDFPESGKTRIRYVLTDIDDTLTLHGRLPAVAFVAMEQLAKAGIRVVPITGRPAGWCDHIARMWPVAGVVGENGAFYFRYDDKNRRMIRRYYSDDRQRAKDRQRLNTVCAKILAAVPGARVSADQSFREADLAIDFCEDVDPLPAAAIERIVNIFEEAGARAKISSIHVNGWFGDYDKLAMTRLFFFEVFQITLDAIRDQVIFSGDSPNDAPMFAFFPHGVGVANLARFADRMAAMPAWITSRQGGLGFAEMTDILLSGVQF